MNTVLERPVAVPQLNPGKWLMAIPVVLYALAVLPFVFHDVVGEPDLERTAMAILYGSTSGLHESAGYHYGLGVSFGYYRGLYHLLPEAVRINSSSLIAAINFVGYSCAVLVIGMLALYTARLFGVLTAVVACILFAFSPVFLDLGTSGHPQLPGLAFTLMSAWLLTYATDTAVRSTYRILAGVLAFAAATVALTMRGDFVLAFPFITLVAHVGELQSRRKWLLAAGQRASVLFAACVAFLILRSFAYDSGPEGDTGFAANFFATFYKTDTVPRGLEVVVLCTGVAATRALVGLIFTRTARQLRLLNVVALVALALPSLAFWLPNSTPGRHLILVTLAIALALALLITRSARARWAIPAAVLLVVSNEAIAEISHGWIDQHYQWTYPSLSGRRATQAVPIGLFPLDHLAKQESFEVLRKEGRAFARGCSGKVLAFAEEPHYMMLSLAELDRSMRFTTVTVGDTKVFQARGARCYVDFVEKAAAWRRGARRLFLEGGYDAQWPIYFQESRRSPSDRTPVPEARRYCLDAPAGGWCASPAPAR